MKSNMIKKFVDFHFFEIGGDTNVLCGHSIYIVIHCRQQRFYYVQDEKIFICLFDVYYDIIYSNGWVC